VLLEGILIGIFGNSIYDIIKGSLKDSLHNKDEDLVTRIHSCLEESSKLFFQKYGHQFGEPSSSFLARQSNIDTIIKSFFYGYNSQLINELIPTGFDGANDVSSEALVDFISMLNSRVMGDFRLEKIVTEKQHIYESKESSEKILDLLSSLVNKGNDNEQDNKSKTSGFNNWIITDESGNKSPLIEGKQYVQKFENGLQITSMFKDGLIFVEMIDLHGQKSYYELDIDGNVKNTKFPYELSEYKLVIPEDQIVSRQSILLGQGLRRDIINLKWNKTADVIYNHKEQLQQMNLSGGWEVKHIDKLIFPSFK